MASERGGQRDRGRSHLLGALGSAILLPNVGLELATLPRDLTHLSNNHVLCCVPGSRIVWIRNTHFHCSPPFSCSWPELGTFSFGTGVPYAPRSSLGWGPIPISEEDGRVATQRASVRLLLFSLSLHTACDRQRKGRDAANNARSRGATTRHGGPGRVERRRGRPAGLQWYHADGARCAHCVLLPVSHNAHAPNQRSGKIPAGECSLHPCSASHTVPKGASTICAGTTSFS